MSRKIVIHCHVGFCGMDSWEFIEVPDDYTEKDLDDLAWQLALNNAESYGYYPPQDNEDFPDAEDSDDNYWSDKISENIDGCWYDYDSEKHDCYRIGGSKPKFENYT